MNFKFEIVSVGLKHSDEFQSKAFNFQFHQRICNDHKSVMRNKNEY